MSLRQHLKSLINLSPSLSTFLRKQKEERARKRPAVVTRHGFRFAGNPAMEDGSFEPIETSIIRSLAPGYDNFVNIGANIGYYCCHSLQLGLPTIAFEPSQSNLSSLLRNLVENGWDDRVEVFPLALSERPGILNFFGEGTGASLLPGWAGVPSQYVSRVPVSTLDRVLGDRLLERRNFFVIDVEGAELGVLRGAARHLDQMAGSAWMVEICISEHLPAGQKTNPHLRQTFDMFWSRGFTAHTADGKATAVTPEMIDAIVQSGVDTLGTHNFVFFKGPVDRVMLDKLRPSGKS
ncbi:FkbM family methyltransferase [Piscinibacter sp. HJYY11]|uniref:FkbM family methyltransferase n=1 Tax=Piscinibacter sp. HJYY11 TaxID=2801333 RepID=UPI00191ED74F|nr:FkbM family methyltransferase [Piscinibacter sp. HJYY11]MBL0727918.1 FkbM family methyltransferase [Piscinibacter sp. HJYY11]